MKIGCILLAGGKSTRMKYEVEKPFISLLGKPIFQYSLEVLTSLNVIDEIVCVTPENRKSLVPKSILWAPPGNRRQDSVQNGLNLLSNSLKWILVHDGARPVIVPQDILTLIEVGKKYPGAALASPINHTLKRVDHDNCVIKTEDRALLWEVYTPQMIEASLLKMGLEKAQKKSLTVTDDLSLLELLGETAKLVPVSFPNIKVTYPQDLYFVEALLQKQYAL